MKVKIGHLRYHERTDGKYRDLRDIEFRFRFRSKRKFARISINGQYRNPKHVKDTHRYANPGWSLGTDQVFLEWIHFRRHCWHFCINAFSRGITFSYGRSVI